MTQEQLDRAFELEMKAQRGTITPQEYSECEFLCAMMTAEESIIFSRRITDALNG